MAFEWTKEKIEFFKDASRYTGFHNQVAETIKPFLKKSWSLCDLGCGLGFLDVAIAPYVKDITAVDVSEIAIDDYKSRIEKDGPSNINIMLADFDKMAGSTWNVILLSFFGKPGEEMDRILSMADDEVIMITYVDPLSEKHGKLKDGAGRPTTSDYEQAIKDRGYEYELILKEMDFGQPFKSLDDAKKYYQSYSRETDPDKKKQLIDKNLKDVVTTDDPEFPYFLSKKKDVGIIIINK